MLQLLSDQEIFVFEETKSTINPKLKLAHYPLPRLDEIFAALIEDKEFSKNFLTTIQVIRIFTFRSTLFRKLVLRFQRT